MPKPDSSLTFILHTAALEPLVKHRGKWQTNLGLKGYALSPSHDSLKNNKFIEKFDPPVCSCPTGKILSMYMSSDPRKPGAKAWNEALCHGEYRLAAGCCVISPGTTALRWTSKYTEAAWDICPVGISDFLVKKYRPWIPLARIIYLIVQFHLLSSASQPSEGPQQPKSTSAQFSALPILQTWLSLAVSR